MANLTILKLWIVAGGLAKTTDAATAATTKMNAIDVARIGLVR
jgi:hypothetical protein